MIFIDFTIFIIYKMFINNSLHTLIHLVDPPSLDTLLIWRSIKVKNQINIFPYSECPEGEWEWGMQKVFGQDEAGDDPFSHLRIFNHYWYDLEHGPFGRSCIESPLFFHHLQSVFLNDS